MADDTYNNTPGFTDTGDGITADPNALGNVTDYEGWDWKQIMAAITGSAASTEPRPRVSCRMALARKANPGRRAGRAAAATGSV